MSAPGAGPPEKLKVFISYSRRDCLDFSGQLASALDACGFESILDRHGISGGEDWQKRLSDLIASAGTVVFVLSPEAAISPICAWEIEEASRLSKRLLPVIAVPLGAVAAPARLQSLNYIYFCPDPSVPDSGFGTGFARLVAALNSDLDWMREHTRLMGLADGWAARSRPDNRLLAGSDIVDAKSWISRKPKAGPEPTPSQLEFIRASELADVARNDAARQQIEEREKLVRDAEAATQERAQALAQAEAALQQTVHLKQRQALVGAFAFCVLAAIGWWAYGIISEQRVLAREATREDVRGQVVSYATARGEHAADTAKGHLTSPYSTAIARTLRQKKKDVVDALVDAHKEVAELSEFGQRPFLSTSMNGHIYLGRQPASRKRHALVVSVDDPNLQGRALLAAPKHDAAAIIAALREVGFGDDQITHLHNVDRTRIERTIADIGGQLRPGGASEPGKPPPNTLLFFFFSGHGVEVGGVDYLIPSMAHGRADREEDFVSDAISARALTNGLDDVSAASVVVLDTHFPALRAAGSR